MKRANVKLGVWKGLPNETFSSFFYRKSLVFVLIAIFFWSGSVFSSSIRERTKSLQSKMKLMQEIHSVLPEDSAKTQKEKLDEIHLLLETQLKNESGKELEKKLRYMEGDVHKLQLDLAENLEIWSARCLADLTRDELLNTRNPRKTMTIADREKKVKYREMAKREKISGEKYLRMNHPSLSLLSFKRSMIYTLHNYEVSGLEIPSKYSSFYRTWIGGESESVLGNSDPKPEN